MLFLLPNYQKARCLPLQVPYLSPPLHSLTATASETYTPLSLSSLLFYQNSAFPLSSLVL